MNAVSPAVDELHKLHHIPNGDGKLLGTVIFQQYGLISNVFQIRSWNPSFCECVMGKSVDPVFPNRISNEFYQAENPVIFLDFNEVGFIDNMIFDHKVSHESDPKREDNV